MQSGCMLQNVCMCMCLHMFVNMHLCLRLCVGVQEFFYSYLHTGTVKSEFLRNASDETWLQHSVKHGYIARCAHTIAAAIDSSVALETESAYATVELGGKMAHGMMIVDWSKSLGLDSNMRIIKSLDLGKVQNFLGAMVQDEMIAADVYTDC